MKEIERERKREKMFIYFNVEFLIKCNASFQICQLVLVYMLVKRLAVVILYRCKI